MNISTKVLALVSAAIIIVMVTILICCGRSSDEKNKYSSRPSASKKATEASAKKEIKDVEISKRTSTSSSKISKEKNAQKRTAVLYGRLNKAFSLYNQSNYEGALREVEGVMRNIYKDPYLEAQAWNMSAMIYDKQGKKSRRKRAYRKMMKCLDSAMKDKRYKNAQAEGMNRADTVKRIVDELKARSGNKKIYEEQELK